MNILDKILAHKEEEVAARKAAASVEALEASPLFGPARKSLCGSLTRKGSTGIIAEIKRKSPSQGDIHSGVSVEKVARGYEAAGAAGISVLTDGHFFGGTSHDLMTVRRAVGLPILRKDFIIDPYQVVEARAIGADVILLIAAALPPEKITELVEVAHDLDLEVLLEVHDATELAANQAAGADLIGVNNRDLKTFEVHLETSLELVSQIPDSAVKVAESGISDPREVLRLKAVGFQGFLMGQRFMEQPDPGAACQGFVEQVQTLSQSMSS